MNADTKEIYVGLILDDILPTQPYTLTDNAPEVITGTLDFSYDLLKIDSLYYGNITIPKKNILLVLKNDNQAELGVSVKLINDKEFIFYQHPDDGDNEKEFNGRIMRVYYKLLDFLSEE